MPEMKWGVLGRLPMMMDGLIDSSCFGNQEGRGMVDTKNSLITKYGKYVAIIYPGEEKKGVGWCLVRKRVTVIRRIRRVLLGLFRVCSLLLPPLSLSAYAYQQYHKRGRISDNLRKKRLQVYLGVEYGRVRQAS